MHFLSSGYIFTFIFCVCIYEKGPCADAIENDCAITARFAATDSWKTLLENAVTQVC